MQNLFKRPFIAILTALALIINGIIAVPAYAAFGSTANIGPRTMGVSHHTGRPPAAPVVNQPPSITDDTTPTIGGTAEEDSRVNVWYLDDLGDPVQICKDVLVDDDDNDDDDDERDAENDNEEDDSEDWSCTSSRVLPEREIELVVNATNKKGDTSADTSYFFTIDTTSADTTPPTVSSINLASPNPSSSPSVDYTVTFSEPVVNVDPDDFALDFDGTISGATIGGVSGSGDTYTVNVNTGTGTGALRLDIPVTATINDLAGNPLAGLPFVGGEAYTIVQTIVPTFEAETIGVFRPNSASWFLRNSNSPGSPDVSTNFGLPDDYPVVGDWDGNGTDTIGVYRNGVFYLSNSNTASTADIVFAFGAPGDQPVAGDWDGDGIDTVGVYRSAAITFHLRNDNSAGAPDMIFFYGVPGDVAITGDWDGDGVDTIGVYRPSTSTWYLKSNNTTGIGDLAFVYGLLGDKPVVADWNDDGIDTVGIYRNNTFYLNNANSNGFADLVVPFGNLGDMPLGGNWDGLP